MKLFRLMPILTIVFFLGSSFTTNECPPKRHLEEVNGTLTCICDYGLVEYNGECVDPSEVDGEPTEPGEIEIGGPSDFNGCRDLIGYELVTQIITPTSVVITPGEARITGGGKLITVKGYGLSYTTSQSYALQYCKSTFWAIMFNGVCNTCSQKLS